MIKFNLVYIASNNYRIITRRIHRTAVSASFQFRKERYYGTNINYDGNAFNVISAYLYSQGNVDSANKDTVRVTRNYESSSFRLHRLMVIDQWNLVIRWTKFRIWADNGSLFRKFLTGILQEIVIIYKIYHLKSGVSNFSFSIFSE